MLWWVSPRRPTNAYAYAGVESGICSLRESPQGTLYKDLVSSITMLSWKKCGLFLNRRDSFHCRRKLIWERAFLILLLQLCMSELYLIIETTGNKNTDTHHCNPSNNSSVNKNSRFALSNHFITVNIFNILNISDQGGRTTFFSNFSFSPSYFCSFWH